jgi:hypothetical protein
MTRKCTHRLKLETAKESGACPATSGSPLRAGSCFILPSSAATVAGIIITGIMVKTTNVVLENLVS